MEDLNSLRDGIASGRLKGQKELKLSDGISEFPQELFALADSLELLVLSNNLLRSLPSSFSKFKRLKIVFFNNNKFETFPAVLAECPQLSMVSFKSNQIRQVPEGVLSSQLRWLILTDNQVEALPHDIGRLRKLQKLMLAGNKLRSLPHQISNCTSLELARLSANQLTELPRELFALPRLAWLAYAGNPFCRTESQSARLEKNTAQLPIVLEAALELGDVLGQGASGVIYKSVWQEQTVAVKIFKGEITSDGLPLDEMSACIQAGSHPNLVSVIARVQRARVTVGLIFSFIPDGYKNLGGPPSLKTCTRDTYDDHVMFSLATVQNIAGSIASAAKHLHQRGIMHGDLYAHNILTDERGDSILGDFGAASLFDIEAKDNLLLKRLESRAFGCLLEDLLDRCSIQKDSGDMVAFEQMRALQKRCMSEVLEERPLMEEIPSLMD